MGFIEVVDGMIKFCVIDVCIKFGVVSFKVFDYSLIYKLFEEFLGIFF